jgi:hypothetical protein
MPCVKLGVRVVSALHKLDEHAPRAARVQERDAEASRPAARHLIDELDALGAALLESGAQVGHGVAGMVESGTSPRKEAGDAGIRLERCEQLDLAALG